MRVLKKPGNLLKEQRKNIESNIVVNESKLHLRNNVYFRTNTP